MKDHITNPYVASDLISYHELRQVPVLGGGQSITTLLKPINGG